MRAYGARVRSAVPVYGGANIVYWVEYLILSDTSRSVWSTRGIAPQRASRNFPIFTRAAPRPTQCRKIKTPHVCKQSGTLFCAVTTPSFGIIFIVMKQRGVQIVFGSFPLPNLTQRRLQVLACIYCISLRNFFWNSNMMPQNRRT